MDDYRKYGDAYKYLGFIVILAAVWYAAFMATNWFIWAHQFINSV